MKAYRVFFRGEYQGTYTATAPTAAYRAAARDYGNSLDRVIETFGCFYSFK